MRENSILETLKYWAEVKPNKKAYVFLESDEKKENQYLTFKQVYDEAYNYAGYLHERGVQKGDRIVIFGEQYVHIGIISDKRNSDGVPYLIHNGGQPVREENMLVKYTMWQPITGHYRFEGKVD